MSTPKESSLRLWLGVTLLLITVTSIGSVGLLPRWWDVALRIAAIIGLCFTLLWKVRPIHHYRVHKDVLDRFDVDEVPERNAIGLRRRAGDARDFSADAVMMFACAIVKLPAFRQRVVETFVPDRRTLQQRVTLDCQVPKQYLPEQAAQELVIYHPLSIFPKGRLQDSFRCVAGSGCSAVGVLSYPEYLRVSARALRMLLLLAFGVKSSSKLPRAVREAEVDCLRRILNREDGSKIQDVPPSKLDLLEAEHPATWKLIKNHTWFDMATALVKKLTNNYAIVAVVETTRAGRFSVAYEQTQIPGLSLEGPGAGRFEKLRSWLRIALGARPIDLTIGIENASTCQSYHLEIEGMEGLYLSEQSAVDMAKTRNKLADGAPTLPHMRFRKRLGQPHAHFYARYFPEPPANEQPKLRFRFDEVPPGVLLRAVVAACSALALVWMVGLMSPGKTPDGTDAPAFLLAFPVIAAAWLGFESPARRLLEGTLPARCSLLVTAAECLIAVGLFMGHADSLGVDWWQLPWGVSVMGISDISWVLLLAIAIVNASYVCYKYWLQTYTYAQISSRESDGEIFQNG